MKKNQYLYRRNALDKSGGFLTDRMDVFATILGWSLVVLLALQWVNIWPISLFGYLTVYCAPVLFICAILSSGAINKIVFSVIFVLIGVLAIMPPQAWQTKPNDNQRLVLSLWSYDAGMNNPDMSATANALQNADTQMLALTGVGGDQWQDALQSVSNTFKYGCGVYPNTPYAMRVMSKVELKDCEVRWVGGEQYPYIRVATTNGKVIYVLRAPDTTTRNGNDDNDVYLEAVAVDVAGEKNPTLVVGNLNIAPLTPEFQKFTKKANVVAQMLNGVPTWHSNGLYLHLDHVLSRLQTDTDSVITGVIPWKLTKHRPVSVNWETES